MLACFQQFMLVFMWGPPFCGAPVRTNVPKFASVYVSKPAFPSERLVSKIKTMPDSTQ